MFLYTLTKTIVLHLFSYLTICLQKVKLLNAISSSAMCEVPANIPAHDRKLREQKLEEEEDLVDRLLKKSGCTEEHYLVQECMVEHQDWRRCQDTLKRFQACISKTQRQPRGGAAQ